MPPLYRVKIRNQELYIEKESQLEDLLAREVIKDIDLTDRAGDTQKFTETRYGRFVKSLHEFDGWASRLRADFGTAPANFVIKHRLVETDAATLGDIEGALASLDGNGHEVSVIEQGRRAHA